MAKTAKRISVFVIAGLALAAAVYSMIPQPEPPLSVRIAVSRTPLSSPFFIAEHQGYFAKAGLNVELEDVIGGHRSFQAMIDGNADLATSSDSVIMFNSFKRNDFSVLTTFVQSDNDIKFIGRRQSGNLSALDLKGRNIAVIKGSASEFFSHTYLMIEGIDRDEVNTVHIPPDKMMAALEQQQVAAISIWEPYAFKALESLQTDALIYQTEGLYNLTFNLLARKSYVSQHPEQVRRVITALQQAIRYLDEHPQESKQIIKAKLSLDDAFIDWIWPDYLFKLSLNQSLISTLESEARWAIESGAVDAQTV
ncbi:MAG: NrtA/SsuA/CpmA family ABC transporter substrate-binding protein, partial [Motiliproteus sp.]|nr:NrtA/SsuA/CpmA family ABC transporter substrate-binding protein [Motiliproteus sp.]